MNPNRRRFLTTLAGLGAATALPHGSPLAAERTGKHALLLIEEGLPFDEQSARGVRHYVTDPGACERRTLPAGHWFTPALIPPIAPDSPRLLIARLSPANHLLAVDALRGPLRGQVLQSDERAGDGHWLVALLNNDIDPIP
jgi:hypothetical protein